MPATTPLDDMLRGYLACALWSSTDPNTERPLDATFSVEDIFPVHVEDAREVCRVFLAANFHDLAEYAERIDTSSDGDAPYAYAGHDLWLTRNGHGAGFWDRGLDDIGERLTEACKALGEVYLLPDGDKLYMEG